MSSGTPTRPEGTFGATARTPSGPRELTGSLACGVSITPGATALAVTPSGP